MPDCSPVKWHLAHTTWFFEQFVLGRMAGYRPLCSMFASLFNSYYHSLGAPYPRPQRGLLSRPTLGDVLKYRRHVDARLVELIDGDLTRPLRDAIVIGLHHERQHQELILTDIQHLFSLNPLEPAYRQSSRVGGSGVEHALVYAPFAGGRVAIGAERTGFAFDNEQPRHERLVAPFQLANRPVCNAEFRRFILDDGYSRRELWLSEGWDRIPGTGADRPLYWDESLESHFTLSGRQPLDPAAPVAHVSYYEAEAYARWAGARLPREEEWEYAAADLPMTGNFLEAGMLTPVAMLPGSDVISQMFGDVWEWTESPYSPYPGYRPWPAPFTEYNGKFMANQMVLRGGSCLSPRRHIRATYRNFLPLDARWQVSGIRLAMDQ